MNRTIFATWMTTLLLSTAALANHDYLPKPPCQESLDQTHELADRIIKNLRGQSGSLSDPYARQKMNNRLDELERLLEKMSREGAGCAAGPGLSPGSGHGHGHGYGVQVRVPISGFDFALVLRSLDDEVFDSARFQQLERIARRHFFTVEQLVQMIRKFSFSSDKIRVVRLFAPRLSDPSNFQRVLAEFTFRSDRQVVERYALDQPWGSGY